jgi:hypothetical protein
MKENKLCFDGNTLVISVSKTSIIVRGIILFFAAFSFLIPLVILIFMVANHADLKFGFVILFIMLWLPAYYLLRIVLWNTYGKERLNISREKVIYEVDYKFFKDSKQELNGDISVEIVKNSSSNKDECTMLLKSETEKIETVIALPYKKWQPAIAEINHLLANETSNLEN